MLSLLLSAFVSVLQVAVGAWIGWAVCRALSARAPQPAAEPLQPGKSLAPGALAPDGEEARRVMARLRDLMKDISADVTQHGSDVEAAGEELSQLPEQADQSVSDLVFSVVTRIVGANALLKDRLTTASAKIREQERQLEQRLAESRIDPLTRVANRRGFDEGLAESLARAGATPLCVAMIDIDYFKRVNDRHGHDVGDEVLRNVAAAIAEALGDAGYVARCGGEEFAVLFAGRSLAEAAQAAEAARRGISRCRVAERPADLTVTVSLGVSEWRLGDDAASLLKRADEALYAAKHAGRDRVMVHDGVACHPPAAPSSQGTSAVGGEPHAADEPRLLVDRPALFQELRHRLAGQRRAGEPLSLLLIEVGPEGAGLEFGRQLLSAVRQGDLAARFAEGQFAVLLPNTSRDAAEKVAERIAQLEFGAIASSTAGPRGLCIGLVEAEPDDDATRLVQRATRALSQDAHSLTAAVLAHAL